MSKPDGGPAFPTQPFSVDAHNWSDGSEGMTLRDYFAGQALNGMFAADTYESVMKTELKVRLAYEAADAMIAERDKP